jgi:hypothetical protein
MAPPFQRKLIFVSLELLDVRSTIISYVASSTLNEWAFDLNDFITDAKTRTSTAQSTPVINDNLYLTNVFAGFEVWSGVSGLKTDKFCIQVK